MEEDLDRIIQQEILTRYHRQQQSALNKRAATSGGGHYTKARRDANSFLTEYINKHSLMHTSLTPNELRDALGPPEYTEEVPYQTALSRHRRRQHTLVFEGFHQVVHSALGSPKSGTTFNYLNPTVSKLAKSPAPTFYQTSNAKQIVSQMASEKVRKMVEEQKMAEFEREIGKNLPSKKEIFEAWNTYKMKATETARPTSIVETSQEKKKRMRAVFGDNEHFNALGARWPLFSQTKVHHMQLGRLMHGLSGQEKGDAYKKLRKRVLDARVA
jgi:hypothetical protein